MYMYIYGYTGTDIYLCIIAYIHTTVLPFHREYIHIYTHIYIGMNSYAYMSVHIYIYIYSDLYTYMYILLYVHRYTYTFIHNHRCIAFPTDDTYICM